MKKALCLALAAALMTTPAFAQTPTGEAASAQVKTATSSGWQKWVFGASAIIIAVTAITVVTLNQGSSPQSQSH
jgi:hypothetical protein